MYPDTGHLIRGGDYMYPDTGHLIQREGMEKGRGLYVPRHRALDPERGCGEGEGDVPRHRALDPERGYGEGEGDYMYPDTGHLIQREGMEKGRGLYVPRHRALDPERGCGEGEGITCTQTQGT